MVIETVDGAFLFFHFYVFFIQQRDTGRVSDLCSAQMKRKSPLTFLTKELIIYLTHYRMNILPQYKSASHVIKCKF